MYELPPPVVPAGVVPFDISAWKARREKRQPEVRPVVEAELRHDDEADWLAWHVSTVQQRAMSNDELRALAIQKGKPIAPGTIEHHDKYTREYNGKEHGNIVRVYRQFAIFGLWADGSEKGPALPAIELDQLKWLAGQKTLPKYLKWFRAQDPEGFANWLEHHPSYRSQAGLPPLPPCQCTADSL